MRIDKCTLLAVTKDQRANIKSVKGRGKGLEEVIKILIFSSDDKCG